MADATYGTKVQKGGGGNDLVIAPGGLLSLESGSTFRKVDTPEAHTADDTLTALESGSTHTSFGAAGTVVLTLPIATVGLNFDFFVGAAQELRLEPNGTETIGLPSSGAQGAAGKYLTANAAGEWVRLRCLVVGTWDVMGYAGTFTAEG